MTEESPLDLTEKLPPPKAVLPLQYSTETTSPWLSVYRIVGKFAVVLSALRIISKLFYCYYVFRMWHYFSEANQVWELAVISTYLIDILLLVGGIQCARQRPIGRKMILAWGWAGLAADMIGSIAYIAIQYTHPYSPYSRTFTMSSIRGLPMQLVHDLELPILFLYLLSRAPLRNAVNNADVPQETR